MYGVSHDDWQELHWTRKMRFKAYADVHAAIRRGDIPKLTKDSVCADCDQQAIAYEHRNYFYPLTVEAVCTKCNILRGEGFPPVEGKSVNSNGLPYRFGGNNSWNGLGGGVEKYTKQPIAVNASTRLSERDEVDRRFDGGMPQYRITQLSEMNGSIKAITRGDLRYEFFKKHDPYYICEDVV